MTTETLSRYQRVKNILNAAQGKVDVSYQGYGRFWELPLKQFLAVVIYGVPLIAAAADDISSADSGWDCGCCDPDAKDSCSCETKDSALQRCLGRGAASGLIKGLKGEAPFDGSQFPALLWGPSATPVAAADTQFIEDWIDDCCPESDDPATVNLQLINSQRVRLAYGEAAHPPSLVHNAHKGNPGQLKVRKAIESLSPDELTRFRQAIAKMQSLDQKYPQDERSFAYWARMHADMCQHGWEQFSTWHRAYLYFFEQRIQDIDETVTLPYWDWTVYAKQPPPPNHPQPTGKKQFSNDTGIIPEQYGCWIDESGLANLKSNIAPERWDKLNAVKGQIFGSGNRLYLKAGIQYSGSAASGSQETEDDLIMTELHRINPLWHRQRWPGINGGPAAVPHYPTPKDIQRILQIPDFPHWGSGPDSDHYFGALETVHNYMHNFAGGVNPNFSEESPFPQNFNEPQFGHMTDNRVTAYDPIFWAHHTNVDRLLAQWQEMHPGVNPQDLNTPLPPFEMTVADSLNTHSLGYEYMQDAHYFPTDNTLGLVRFRSESVPVSHRVLQNHRRAEIRLHRVQIAQRGANIRIFLNQPDATADTPLEGNEHYVGKFFTFTGFCYGGPGHCDVPAETRRPYDHRMHHHKTPGNLRFDATEVVKKLRTNHTGKLLPLSVHLVVTDLNGQTREDLLKMDGVSINFIH